MAKKKYMILSANEDDDDDKSDIVVNNNNSSSSSNSSTNNGNEQDHYRNNGNSNGGSKRRNSVTTAVVVDHVDDDEDGIDTPSDVTATLLQPVPPSTIGSDTIIQFPVDYSYYGEDSGMEQLDNPFATGPFRASSMTNWRDIIRTTRASVNRTPSSSLPRTSTSQDTTTTTNTTQTNQSVVPSSPPTSSAHFPFPSTLSTRWENAQLKERDTLVIRHPDGKLSLGLNETKFYHHTSTGEHDPNGLYVGLADPDILLQHYNQNGIPSVTLQDQDHIYLESYGMYDGFQNGGFETYRRKKFLVSLITCEVFYSALLMAEIMHFNGMMLMLVLVILTDLMGVYALSKNKLMTLSSFIFLTGSSMFAQIVFQMYTPLFLLRMIIFMIACRVRHDMMLYGSSATA